MGESIAEVAAIAAKLTKEQRDLVLVDGRQSLPVAWMDVAALHRMDLFEHRHTPLGLAVRNHLISQGADHAR